MLLIVIAVLMIVCNAYAVMPMADSVHGETSYAVTDSYYLQDELLQLNQELQAEGYDYRVASIDDQDEASFIHKQYGKYDVLLTSSGLWDTNAEKKCVLAGDFWNCPSAGFKRANQKYRVLLEAEAKNEENPVNLPFCNRRCYDARTDLDTPFTWKSTDGTVQKTIDVKKGFAGWGMIRPYTSGCFVNGKFSLCINIQGSQGSLSLSFVHSDGTQYNVSCQIQPKFWNTFSFSVNPNLIALFCRQHGRQNTDFQYIDLDYKPLDNDKIENHYSFTISLTPVISDPYDFQLVEFEKGTLSAYKKPFCSEQIALCNYDVVMFHAWEEYEKVFFGGVYAKNISETQYAVSDYFRNNVYESLYNYGDLQLSSPQNPGQGGIYRIWWEGTYPRLSLVGISQLKTLNDITEEYGYTFDETLKPEYIGFYRGIGDFGRQVAGYDSDRHSSWIQVNNATQGWYQDHGIVPQSCSPGEVETIDGCFKDFAPLCPGGQVELYKDYEGYCYEFVENAGCWEENGQQFGNQCYIKQQNPPDVCPSDGNTWTLLTPSDEDYICETTKSPSCPSGQVRRNGYCYAQTNPSCPSGSVQEGSYCYYYQDATCPSGYQSICSSYYHCCLKTSQDHSDFSYYVGYGSCTIWNGSQITGSKYHSGRCSTNVSYKFADFIEIPGQGVCTDSVTYIDDCGCVVNQCDEQHACDYGYQCYTYYGQLKCIKYVQNPPCSAGTVWINGQCWEMKDPSTPPSYCYKDKSCPYGYYYDYSSQKCRKYAGSACPYGYYYNYSTQKCEKYAGYACPSGYSYDYSRDTCYRRVEAQCSVGERKKDPNTGWSACYLLDTSVGEPPGHIYCRNNLTYWNHGGKEGCYRLKGIACNGQYFSSNPVIIGSGNSYDEWTGTCWRKTKDICPSGTVKLRGKHIQEDRCLKLKREIQHITSGQVSPSQFSKYMCEYVAREYLDMSDSSSPYCWQMQFPYDAYAGFNRSAVDENYLYRCPIDPNQRCTAVGGRIAMCGVDKACSGCFDEHLEENPQYGAFKKVLQKNGKAYGLSWEKMKKEYAEQIASGVKGRLPGSSEKNLIENLFQMSFDFWLSDSQANQDEKKYLVVVWDNPSDAGFLAECVYDDEGNGLCTADMVECVNGHCPYGDQYPCQRYQGKLYCSKFSENCKSLADPSNFPTENDTEEGAGDKKDDGQIDENGNCLGTIYIFNGKDRRCRLPGIQTGFSDCCKKKTTWFGLGQCSPTEKILSKLRSWGKLDGQCHYVGKYCSLKVFGICLQKKKTFCCFNSVLARIIHEQGRPQLSISWGKPKHPNCRGFTPDEFQKIDFSKVDFSEWLPEVESKLTNATQNIQSNINNAAQEIQDYYKK